MATYKIKHITNYFYDKPVYDSINQLMVYPIQDYYQKIHYLNIRISNNPSVQTFTDKYHNLLGIFNILELHNQLTIIADMEVDVKPMVEPIFELSVEEQWSALVKIKSDFLIRDFLKYEDFKEFEAVKSEILYLLNKELSPFENAKNLSAYVFSNFKYRQGVTSVETSIDEIWNFKAGVCQDFAHILLIMLRISNIPARYVSGYICPENHDLRGEGATHAWVEVFLPESGWIGLDPTNNCITSDRHIKLAVGRYFSDCTPVKGIFKGFSDHRLEVSVIVENNMSTNKNRLQNFFNEKQIEKPSFISYSKTSTDPIKNSYQQQIQMQIQQ
jgi:transglutaminase-like putative cysteine protease